MKNFLSILFLIAGMFISNAQDLNSYRYVLVPEKFEFLKEPDQYQLNSLAKFLFEKYGFEVFLEGEEIPAELNQNRCEGLFAQVTNDSGLFRTRLTLTLRDCNNKVVYTSPEGTSGEKDYQTAFHEALRNAFSALEALNYNYKETIVSGRPAINPEEGYETPVSEVRPEIEARATDPVKLEVQVSAQNEMKTQKRLAEATTLHFTKAGEFFTLEKTQRGYSLFQKGMSEPFAALIRSSVGNSYAYTSITTKGMAHFDDNGNLVIEVLNPQSNSLEAVIYHVQP